MKIGSLSFSRGGSVVGWEILGIEVLARMIAGGKLILQSAMLIVIHARFAICVSNRNSNALFAILSLTHSTLGARITLTQSY